MKNRSLMAYKIKIKKSYVISARTPPFIEGELYILRKVGTHRILKSP